MSFISSLRMNFWREPRIFKDAGKRGGEFDDAMIEKRRAHFDGVGHAHAVNFSQNVVGQKIFLIEPEVRGQVGSLPRSSSRAEFAKDAVERVGKWDCSRALASAPRRTCRSNRRARARAACRQPSRKRFSLYSKLILSSETGQWLTACSARRMAADGRRRSGARESGWRDR